MEDERCKRVMIVCYDNDPRVATSIGETFS